MADSVESEVIITKAELPHDKITLFDMRFTTPDERLSPYTSLIRYAFKIKNLPFHVHFIDMHTVRSVSEQMGFKPVFVFEDGTPLYTLPAIWDPMGDERNIGDATGGGEGKGNRKRGGNPNTNDGGVIIGDSERANKGVALADSLPICQYLDNQYPSTSALISPTPPSSINVSESPASPASTHLPPKPPVPPKSGPHTSHQVTAFLRSHRLLDLSILPFITPQTLTHIPPQSVGYFRKTRESWVGKRLEEMRPVGEEGARAWMRVREGWEGLAQDAGGPGVRAGEGDIEVEGGGEGGGENNPAFRYGLENRLKVLKAGIATPGYVDAFIAGRLYWIRKAFGATSEEWVDVKTWSGGMWAELLDLFEERYG